MFIAERRVNAVAHWPERKPRLIHGSAVVGQSESRFVDSDIQSDLSDGHLVFLKNGSCRTFESIEEENKTCFTCTHTHATHSDNNKHTFKLQRATKGATILLHLSPFNIKEL